MLDRIPYLHQFSSLYWHQMGDEVYGTIGNAFRQYLADAARLPDRGKSYRRALYGELMLIAEGPEYGEWVEAHKEDPETTDAVSGQFILPADIATLLAVLDEEAELDS